MTKRKSYLDEDGEVVELDAQFFREAVRGRPEVLGRKESVTLRLDRDVVAHFKGDDEEGWQTRVNAALRAAAGLDG